MEMDMVADMGVDMVADMDVDMVADMVVNMEEDTMLTKFHNFNQISQFQQFWPSASAKLQKISQF